MTESVTCHYVDVGGRRVHYRRRGSGPAVVLLHASPRSSAALVPLMDQAPTGVSVYAFDTPGCGYSSTLATNRPDATAYAHGFAATLDALGIARAAAYGTHTGAALAIAFAVLHPERVTRLVLDGLSEFSGEERASMLANYLPPFRPLDDGTHLSWLWSRVRDQSIFFPWNHRGAGARLPGPLPQAAQLQKTAMDFLAAGDNYRSPYAAAIAFCPTQWLPALRMPTTIGARRDDVLFSHLARLGDISSVSADIAIETYPAERAPWAAMIWQRLLEQSDTRAATAINAAGLPSDARLPLHEPADAYVQVAARRVHLRGALGGTGKPLVVLHPSPGGARGMDRYLQRACAEHRPVIAPDLPGHGDSESDHDRPAGLESLVQTAQVVHGAVVQTGIDHADVTGEGLGAWLANLLQSLYPGFYNCVVPCPRLHASASPPPSFPVRTDGGHLMAAWFHVRDEAIYGSWLDGTCAGSTPFGDSLDIEMLHKAAVDVLKEGPSAQHLRRALLATARAQ